MCGIVACKLKRPLTSGDIAFMNNIRDDMAYRGPDASGEYVSFEDGLYLGHRRLSIIDLDPRSAQPMRDDNLIISYNGEVYNYIEIAKFLGKSNHTQSDTAVILQAWKSLGTKALDLFDGMYAFAIWDDSKKKLSLATDLFGEKPLYSYENEEGVYFCSEARPLIKAFNLDFSPSENEIADFLYLGYIRPPSTGYKNLHNIGAACLIEINANNDMAKREYWSLPEQKINTGPVQKVGKDECDKIRDILCTSLERRLRADVSIGLFLSGGVDSSLVAALAAKELGQDLRTYTVAFPDGKDESVIADKIANYLGLNHTIINSRSDDLWKRAPQELCDIYGVPNDNMTALAVYQMCKEAKNHLTVAISGLGGDELFYGYNKYETLYRLRALYQNSKIAASLGGVLRHIPTIGQKFYLMQDLVCGERDRQYLRIKNSDHYKKLQNLYSKIPEKVLENNKRDLVHDVRTFDIMSSMPQSYIPAVDRGSMRASVEVRTPFLSRDLMVYVSSLDQRALISYGKKNVLREILSEYLPLDMLYQGKQGFVFPSARYFKECNPKKPELSMINQSAVDDLWSNLNEGENEMILLRLSVLDHMMNS